MSALVPGPYGPGAQPPQGPPPNAVSNNWYLGLLGRGGASLTTASVTTLYAGLFYNPRPLTAKTLGIWLITGQTSGKIQLALYRDNGSGLPLFTGGPLVSTADITATASSVNVNGSVTAAPIPVGYVWACVMGNNTGIVVAGASQDPGNLTLYSGASSQGTLQSAVNVVMGGVTLTGQTYGTWPTSGTAAPVITAATPQVQVQAA